MFTKSINYILFALVAAFSILTTYSLYIDSKSTSIALLGIILLGILTYLVVWNLNAFLTFYAFLIPLSVPTSLGGNVLSMPSEFLLILSGIFLIIRVIILRTVSLKLVNHPISVLLLIGLLWATITSLTSTIPSVSFKRTLMTFFFIIVFFYVYAEYFKEVKNIKNFFLAYGLGMIVPVLWALYTHQQQGFSMISAFDVNKPFYTEHTIYAACLSFVIVVLISFRRGLVGLVSISPLLLILGLGIYFSFSRAAWLSIMLATGVFLVYKFKPARWIKVLMVIFGLLILNFNIDRITEEFEHNREVGYKGDLTEHLQSLTNISNDASNAERINRWVSAIGMFQDKPIMGFGPGTYQFKYGNYQRPEFMTRISTFQGDGGNAHSEYLNLLAEQGLVGLAILLILLGIVFTTAQRIILKSESKLHRNLAMAVLLGLMTYFSHGFVNSFMDVDKAAVLVFGSFAALVALDNKEKELKANLSASS